MSARAQDRWIDEQGVFSKGKKRREAPSPTTLTQAKPERAKQGGREGEEMIHTAQASIGKCCIVGTVLWWLQASIAKYPTGNRRNAKRFACPPRPLALLHLPPRRLVRLLARIFRLTLAILLSGRASGVRWRPRRPWETVSGDGQAREDTGAARAVGAIRLGGSVDDGGSIRTGACS